MTGLPILHFAFCILHFAFASPCLAQLDEVAAADAAVESGRRALDQGIISRTHPWYDSDTDGVRRIRLGKPSSNSSNADLSGLSLLLKGAAWSALVLAIVGLAWLFIWAFLRRDRAPISASDALALSDRGSDVDRVEALPFRIQRQTTDLLSEAQRCYQRGDYSEAIIYLFSHQLVELDRNQLIRLARGKTNRQCVREIAPRRPLALLVGETMVAFEDVFFGGQTLSRARFEASWLRVEEFQRLVQEAAA